MGWDACKRSLGSKAHETPRCTRWRQASIVKFRIGDNGIVLYTRRSSTALYPLYLPAVCGRVSTSGRPSGECFLASVRIGACSKRTADGPHGPANATDATPLLPCICVSWELRMSGLCDGAVTIVKVPAVVSVSEPRVSTCLNSTFAQHRAKVTMTTRLREYGRTWSTNLSSTRARLRYSGAGTEH
jgi:hypothetical protein